MSSLHKILDCSTRVRYFFNMKCNSTKLKTSSSNLLDQIQSRSWHVKMHVIRSKLDWVRIADIRVATRPLLCLLYDTQFCSEVRVLLESTKNVEYHLISQKVVPRTKLLERNWENRDYKRGVIIELTITNGSQLYLHPGILFVLNASDNIVDAFNWFEGCQSNSYHDSISSQILLDLGLSVGVKCIVYIAIYYDYWWYFMMVI